MVDRTRVNSQLNCEQVWHEISNYVEGEVDAALRTGMDEHFRTCKRCASVLEGTRNVIRLYGDERMIEVPSGFGRRLEKRLAQNARAGRARWSTWSAWLVPVAALVLITAGVWLTNSYTTARREQSQMAAIEHNIPSDMQVVVSDGAKVFHVAGCHYIHNKDKVRTITAKEAIQDGYTPCLHCLRKYVDTTAAVGHTALGTVADSRDADADEEKHEGGQ
jgi:methylphosphotriester-DNA--protein-cysteine methyltransferase